MNSSAFAENSTSPSEIREIAMTTGLTTGDVRKVIDSLQKAAVHGDVKPSNILREKLLEEAGKATAISGLGVLAGAGLSVLLETSLVVGVILPPLIGAIGGAVVLGAEWKAIRDIWRKLKQSELVDPC